MSMGIMGTPEGSRQIKIEDKNKINFPLEQIKLSKNQKKLDKAKLEIDSQITEKPFHKFTEKDTKEKMCHEFSEFIKSLPTNQKLNPNGDYYSKVRDLFKSLSLRRYTYSFLERTQSITGFDISSIIAGIRIKKSQLIKMKTNQNELYLFRNSSQNKDKIIMYAIEMINKLNIEKLEKQALRQKLIGTNVQKILLLSQQTTILQNNDSFLEDKIILFRSLRMLESLLDNCVSDGCPELPALSFINEFEMPYMQKQFKKLVDMLQDVQILKRQVEFIQLQLQYLKNQQQIQFLTNLKGRFDSEIQMANNRVNDQVIILKHEISFATKYFSKFFEELQLYKKYEETLDEYLSEKQRIKTLDKEMAKLDDSIVEFNKMKIMGNQEGNNYDDLILPYNFELDLMEEIKVAESVNSLFDKQFNFDKSSILQDISLTLKQFYDTQHLVENNSQLINFLTNKLNLLRSILADEKTIDLHLASLLNQAFLLSPNRKCFSNVKIGHSLFIFSKYNLVIHFQDFTRQFLEGLDYFHAREFILENYAVFMSRTFLKQIRDKFPIYKMFENEQDHYLKTNIESFVNRFSGLIIIYKQRENSFMQAYQNSSQGIQAHLFIANGFISEMDTWKLYMQEPSHLLRDVTDYIKDLIPFLGILRFVQETIRYIIKGIVKYVFKIVKIVMGDTLENTKLVTEKLYKVISRLLNMEKMSSLNFLRMIEDDKDFMFEKLTQEGQEEYHANNFLLIDEFYVKSLKAEKKYLKDSGIVEMGFRKGQEYTLNSLRYEKNIPLYVGLIGNYYSAYLTSHQRLI